MALFRDWPRTLRPASYRGVGFFVEMNSDDSGIRMEVHEFPHAKEPYVEELGNKANFYDITAYVLGDSADTEAEALKRACNAGGPALLSLPLERLQAHCEDCKRAFKKDQLGYIAFDLKLVRTGLTAGPFPVGFLSSLVSNLVAAFKTSAKAYVARSFRGVRVSGFVRDSAAAEVQAIAAVADSLLRSNSFSTAKVPALLKKAQALYDTAAVLTASGAAGQTYTSVSFASTGAEVSTDPLASAISELVTEMAAASLGGVFETLAVLVEYNSDLEPGGATPSRVQERANTMCLSALVRMTALAGLAQRVAETRYTDRRQVIQARANVAELFDTELLRLNVRRDHDVYVALSDIAGRTVEYLTRLYADLAPVVVIESPRTLPSLYWSQRIYGEAGRAGEIATRNGIKHPGFMPLSFEALAR